MAFPISPVTGQTTSINGITYTYDGTTSSWTRSLQSLPSLSITVDTFVSDGATLSYTLSSTPATKELVTVNIDGVLQQKTAYNLSTNIITLTGTPVTGSIIEVKTISASPLSVLTGLIFDTFTGDGTTVNFTLSTTPTTKYFTLVTIAGVVQSKANYNVSSNILTFVSAPTNASTIEVTTFGPAISGITAMAAGSNTQIQFNNSGVLGASSFLTYNTGNSTLSANTIAANVFNGNTINATGNIIGSSSLYVGSGASSTTFVNPTAIFKNTGLTYIQTAIVNSSGNGSADLAAYGNNGDDTQSWTDIGFTGNTFNDTNYTVTAPGDGYLFVQGNTSFGGNLVLATGNIGTTKDIVFATGGFQTGNIKARLYNSNGTFNVSNTLSAGNIYTSGSLTVVGTATFQLTADTLTPLTGATGVVAHDMAVGAVFYHINPAANFTANFLNLPTTANQALVVTMVINQGATGYLPTAVQIAGVAQTIKWLGGTAPTASTSKTDVVSFSFLRVSGSWVVMGQLASFS